MSELKISDLSVGDWVMYGGRPKKVGVIDLYKKKILTMQGLDFLCISKVMGGIEFIITISRILPLFLSHLRFSKRTGSITAIMRCGVSAKGRSFHTSEESIAFIFTIAI